VNALAFLRTLIARLAGKNPALLAPGTPAPDFDLPDHAGQRVRLADLAGRRAVLWFYPRASTPG
jgi:peroxiredoxin Q/BCP